MDRAMLRPNCFELAVEFPQQLIEYFVHPPVFVRDSPGSRKRGSVSRGIALFQLSKPAVNIEYFILEINLSLLRRLRE